MKKEKEKKPIYKRWWFWVIIVFIVLGIIGSLEPNEDSTTASDNDNTEVVENTESTQPTEDDVDTSEDVEAGKAEEENSKEIGKEDLKDSEGLVWFGNVRNDTTGNWRLSEYASTDTQETFAVEYYNAFFESDDEIHAVINMTNKTTAKISKLMDDTLDVTIYEYVDGEEHDAGKLFGGTLLGEYLVTISTGEIEEIQ